MDPVDAWTGILDELESTVELAETLVEDPFAPLPQGSLGSWEEPQVRSMLPAELMDRARSLVRRQQAAHLLIATRLEELRGERARMRPAGRPNPPATASAYLDVNA